MKQFNLFCRVVLFGLVCSLSIPAFSRGVVTDNSANEDNCTNNGKEAVAQHEAVDLGLSVKWATCNVGATAPERAGGYYAWGETVEKRNYDWSTYKWCKGSSNTLTKYCTDSSYGAVDNKTVLDPEDDVAHVKWGGSWRMPTIEEHEELGRLCTLVWCSVNNVSGCKVIGPNGNSVFFPAAGVKYDCCLEGKGEVFVGWLNTLYNKEDYTYCAYCIELELAELEPDYDAYDREMGLSVRPVCK